jgi:magnesium-dependent phosphatase 1
MNRPKLIAFDLDGLVWTPDMYQLWGGGSPFTSVSHNTLKDSRGSKVRLLGVISELLHELKHNEEWKDTKVAWVSCCDEPSWADECLSLFRTRSGSDGITIVQAAHSRQV